MENILIRKGQLLPVFTTILPQILDEQIHFKNQCGTKAQYRSSKMRK